MSYPPVPFKVVGIEEWAVVPIVKDQLYTITGVSDDGMKWQTRGPDGKLGWFPARLCEAMPKKTTVAPVRPITSSVNTAQPRQVTPITSSNSNRNMTPNTVTSPPARQQPRQVEPVMEKRTMAKSPSQNSSVVPMQKPVQHTQVQHTQVQYTPPPQQHQQNDFNVDDILANFKGFDDI